VHQGDDGVDAVALDLVNGHPVRSGEAAALASMHDHHALAGPMLDRGRFHQAAAG
jgi:hypothetical protein